MPQKMSPHPTPTPDTFSTAPYVTDVIDLLSRESGRSLGIDAITRFVTTPHDVPNFRKDCLLEAMTQGVEEGYFTENAGQYLLNRKQSPINADAAEDVSDINFGACADDIFNVEDQQEVTPNMAQNTDM